MRVEPIEDYEIGFCSKSQVTDLTSFIHKHWKPNHALSTSRTLLDWQHWDGETGQYHFVIARHRRQNQIHGVLGFIPTHLFDPELKSEKTYWTALWKATDHSTSPFLGSQLLYFLTQALQPNVIGGVGLSETAIPFYRYLGFTVGKLPHLFMANPLMSQFAILRNPERSNRVPIADPNVKLMSLEPAELSEFINQWNLAHPKPIKKTSVFFKNRYSNHPFYQYQIKAVVRDNAIQGITVLRTQQVLEAKVIRMVDLYGDPFHGTGVGSLFQNLVEREHAEYIDCYCLGWENSLRKAGFVDRTSAMIVPNHFEPYRQTNIDLYFAFKCKLGMTVNIVKGDGDQDRPSQISIKGGEHVSKSQYLTNRDYLPGNR